VLDAVDDALGPFLASADDPSDRPTRFVICQRRTLEAAATT